MQPTPEKLKKRIRNAGSFISFFGWLGVITLPIVYALSWVYPISIIPFFFVSAFFLSLTGGLLGNRVAKGKDRGIRTYLWILAGICTIEFLLSMAALVVTGDHTSTGATIILPIVKIFIVGFGLEAYHLLKKHGNLDTLRLEKVSYKLNSLGWGLFLLLALTSLTEACSIAFPNATEEQPQTTSSEDALIYAHTTLKALPWNASTDLMAGIKGLKVIVTPISQSSIPTEEVKGIVYSKIKELGIPLDNTAPFYPAENEGVLMVQIEEQEIGSNCVVKAEISLQREVWSWVNGKFVRSIATVWNYNNCHYAAKEEINQTILSGTQDLVDTFALWWNGPVMGN